MSRTTIFQPVMIPSPLFPFLRTLLHHTSCLSASPPVLFNKRWRLSPPLGSSAFTLHSRTPPPLVSLSPSGRLSPDAGSGYTSIGLRLQPSLCAAACRSVSMTCLHAPPSSSVSPSLTSSLLCFILPHLLSMQTTVSVTQTLPLFLFFSHPSCTAVSSSPRFPPALSSLSITLSVIDGGAGRQPGKRVLHVRPFLRLLPPFGRLCLSARPRRCCSYLFPGTLPLSPPALTPLSLCCLATFAVHGQSGSHDTMMWPSAFSVEFRSRGS